MLQAHVLLHFIHSSSKGKSVSLNNGKDDYSNFMPTENELEAHVAESCKMVSTAYGIFKRKAAEQVRWSCTFIYIQPYAVCYLVIDSYEMKKKKKKC